MNRLASLHLGARDISRLVQEVEITRLFFHANLLNFLRPAALFATARHFRPRDISLFVDEIEIALLPFHSRFRDFFCHVVVTSPSVMFGIYRSGFILYRRQRTCQHSFFDERRKYLTWLDFGVLRKAGGANVFAEDFPSTAGHCGIVDANDGRFFHRGFHIAARIRTAQ